MPQPRTVAPLSLGRDTNNDAFLAATKDFTLEDVVPLLRSLAADPESAAAADAVIQANAATICVDSLEAGIEAVFVVENRQLFSRLGRIYRGLHPGGPRKRPQRFCLILLRNRKNGSFWTPPIFPEIWQRF